MGGILFKEAAIRGESLGGHALVIRVDLADRARQNGIFFQGVGIDAFDGFEFGRVAARKRGIGAGNRTIIVILEVGIDAEIKGIFDPEAADQQGGAA